MELYLDLCKRFLEEYLNFLYQWPSHIFFFAIDYLIFALIMRRLVKTGHAKLGKNGSSVDIACGDIRVHRDFVIFGGPAGLTFGIPYFLIYTFLPHGGMFQEIFREYWAGFIYVQLVTSVVQTAVLFKHALLSKRPEGSFRLFKSHLKGCGYVSAVSPIGWILYVIQQKLPNDKTHLIWKLRDIETRAAFWFNLATGTTVLICLISSFLNARFIIPWITDIDQDHEEDEDSHRENGKK